MGRRGKQIHANENVEGECRRGQESEGREKRAGDECSSPDKGVCIPPLGEKQRECEGREGGRERKEENRTAD